MMKAGRKIAAATKQFESMLTQMMLKSMNKTNGGMLGEEGYGNDMFDTVFEQEIASYMGETKVLELPRCSTKKLPVKMTPDMLQINNQIADENKEYYYRNRCH